MQNLRRAARIAVAASVLFIATGAQALEQATVAVLELDVAGGVSEAYARPLSDRLRQELFKTGEFLVVERGIMEEILQEQAIQLSGCTTNECAVEAGRVLGVEQMVAGSVARVGEVLSVSVRLIDVESSRVLAAESVDCTCSIEEVLTDRIRQAAVQLAGAVRPDTAAVPESRPLPAETAEDGTVRRDTLDRPPWHTPEVDRWTRHTLGTLEAGGLAAFSLSTGVGTVPGASQAWFGSTTNGMEITLAPMRGGYYPSLGFSGGSVGATVDGVWTSVSLGGLRARIYRFFGEPRRGRDGPYYGLGLGAFSVTRIGVDPRDAGNVEWDGTYGHLDLQATLGLMRDIDAWHVAGRPFYWYAELNYDRLLTSGSPPNHFVSITLGFGLKLDTF